MSAADDLANLAAKYGISQDYKQDIPDLERRHPEDYANVLRDYEAQYERRGRPTASAGGTGGDADTDGIPGIDPGWSQGSGGQWTRSGAGSRPGTLASLLMPTPQTSQPGPMGGTSMPRTGNPMLDALIAQAFAGQQPGQPVSTSMPVGGQPQLSALLRY